ncbi:MAG TPA: calcium-binding protein, partial [Dongiaceae bacterium]|nr:calcium-binding protein [Dongiaceae bacterium]
VDGGGGYNTLSYERAATLLDNQGNPFGAIFDPLNGNVIYSLSGRGTIFDPDSAHIQSFIGTIYDDTFLGGKGDYNFNGGITGTDTLSFVNSGGAITLTLTSYFTAQFDPNHIFYPSGFEGYGHDGFYTYEDTSGLYTGVFQNIDRYLGSMFDDRLFGGWSDDTIDGGAGNDYFRGGIGNDTLIGGNGNDLIFAGPGNDVISGGNDNDFLTGGLSGDDVLYGGSGDDLIEEYSGRNILTGGGGHDTFVFDTLIRASAQPSYLGEVHDTLNIVTDFHVGDVFNDANADRLDLSPLLGNLFFQATALTAIDPAVTGSTSLTNITGFDGAADPTGATLNDFVRVIQINGAGDYHLQINVDGTRSFAQFEGLTGGWTDVAILQGTRGATLSLDQLLANNEIIFTAHQQQSQAHGGTLAEYPYVLGDPNTAPYYHPALPAPNHP